MGWQASVRYRKLVTGLTLLASHAWLTGCDVDLVGKQTFNLQMLGVEVPADGAAGDASPKSLTYQLTGITFVAEAGGTDLDFALPDSSKSYRIVGRPQILFSQDLSVDEETSYQHATLTFAAEVSGENAAGDALSFTMANPSLTSESFAIKKGRDLNIIIKVNWKNSVSGATISEPSTAISVTH